MKGSNNMLKCSFCERSFAEDEITIYRGDKVCPYCGHEDFEEAIQCKVCGDYFFYDELTCGVCEDCKEDLKFPYKYDPKSCYELSKDEQEEVSLNAFLVSQFTPEQIEEVLMRDLILATTEMPPDYSSFIDSDEMWFIEKVLEEVKMDE
jgi:hypothetical protein